MRTTVGILLGAALTLAAPRAHAADLFLRGELERVNRCLRGQILDFTHNHGKDCRIWSPALCAKRDMYVYVPPGFDPAKKYPLGIFLHGAAQDEQFFLKVIAKEFDKAIAASDLPPVIVAAPDGSMLGRPDRKSVV